MTLLASSETSLTELEMRVKGEDGSRICYVNIVQGLGSLEICNTQVHGCHRPHGLLVTEHQRPTSKGIFL